MDKAIQSAATAIERMDKQLRSEFLRGDKLWENTFIKRQIDRRRSGGKFSTCDHIRAMVYSMLSSGIVWDRVAPYIDETTKRLTPIDEAFFQYDPQQLLQCTPEQLSGEIQSLHCGSQYTAKQMQALIRVNIPKLLEIESRYGSVDKLYERAITEDPTLKALVQTLSAPHSEYKLAQMGEALVAEYLKNVGYDIAKPDRHIRRILGSGALGCSEHETVPIMEAFDLVAELAKVLGKSAAEVDYILWAYCAKGYGEICTAKNPKCKICVTDKCRKKREGAD